MDDTTKEFDQVMMNVQRYGGGVLMLTVLSARLSFKLLTYILRLAKKGLVSAGIADRFKDFSKKTEGSFTVYNIPLTKERAEDMQKLHDLELTLEKVTNPIKKSRIRNEIKSLQKNIPEIEQLERLQIKHCVLPKLNGSSQTIQVAIGKSDDQVFKNWFINHLTAELRGGEMNMEELRVFTEGNYTIFNLPVEGEDFQEILPDFNILDINYSVMPDLKVGDNNTQIAIPNADRNKFEVWTKMWRAKQIKDGKEPGEIYQMSQESYMNTGSVSAASYINGSDQKYQEANKEFEQNSTQVLWTAKLGKENSEEYVRLLQDDNYEKITINHETLVNNLEINEATEKMAQSGYFISRVPGTYKAGQQTLILPADHVFVTDEGATYIGFLPKNGTTMIADAQGNIQECDFKTAYDPYDKVNRGFAQVDNLIQGKELKTDISAPAQNVTQNVAQNAANAIPAPKL